MHTVVIALLAAALYGTAYVTTHFALRHMDALAGARVSVPSACLLFWLLAPALDWSAWHATAVAIFALVGLFYPALVTLLIFAANRRLGPTVSGAIGSTTPLFAALGAAVFLNEMFGAAELAGTVAIVVGTMALSRPSDGTGGRVRGGGLWLPWSAALLRSGAQILSKAGLVLWTSPLAAVLAGYTVSTAVLWGSGLFRPVRARASFTRSGVAWFAVTGILNGCALLATYWALATGPVHVVSPVVAIYPLFTLLVSGILLRRESLTPRLLAGVALTVAGVATLAARQ
jgi:drug/metabolite transporter (DMT)-like permease